MFSFLKKKKVLQVSSKLSAVGVEINLKLVGRDSDIKFPLSLVGRREISEIAPKIADAFFSMEAFFLQMSNLDRSQIGSENVFGFEAAEVEAPPVHFQNGNLHLSYTLIYALVFGEVGKLVGVKKSDLSSLGVPKYSVIDIKISDHLIPQRSDFRISAQYSNSKNLLFEPAVILGSSMRDKAGNEYLLLPSQAHLIRTLEKHKLNSLSSQYRMSEAMRLRDLASIQSAAKIAKATISKSIEDNQIVIMDSVPYEIGRDLNDEVVVNPVMPRYF